MAAPGRAGGLWAITSHFNPAGYERRRSNFREFRKRLDVPLVAVELSFDGRFELGCSDADVLVRLRGRDVMWQKERLLNIALASLPAEATAVAWLDSDVVFEEPDWPERAEAKLDQYVFVQPFQRSFRLPRDLLPEDVDRTTMKHRYSFGCNLARGVLTTDVLRAWDYDGDFPNDGYGWVGRRDVLEKHGFYDTRVIGGGGRDLLLAGLGEFDALIEGRPMTARHAEHFRRWARPVFAAVQGRLGYVEGDVFHLWHGAQVHRRNIDRHLDLTEFDFDPDTDIALAENRCWRWNSHKPEMHERVRQYFVGRRDDG